MADAAVLLVDDDPPILRMLERTLAAEGYDVDAVSDGGAALARVERSVPDLIVLDAVADEGPGLSPEHAEHAFERFWRGPGARFTSELPAIRDLSNSRRTHEGPAPEGRRS